MIHANQPLARQHLGIVESGLQVVHGSTRDSEGREAFKPNLACLGGEDAIELIEYFLSVFVTAGEVGKARVLREVGATDAVAERCQKLSFAQATVIHPSAVGIA